MKIIYGILLVAFLVVFAKNITYACDDNLKAYYEDNALKGGVKQVALKILPPTMVDLGSVEPGEEINPNKNAVFTIQGAKGYRFNLEVKIDMKDNLDGLLSIAGNYMLENVFSWTAIPTTGILNLNSCNMKIPNERELDFTINVNKLKAEPGARVGERLFKVYITASYYE